MTSTHHHEHTCDESGALAADFSYQLPNERTPRYVSRQHLQAVQHRLQALGLVNISGGLEPDLVQFTALPRPITEHKIDWMGLARQYQAEAESLRERFSVEHDRRMWAEGEISVKQRELDQLREEMGQLRHLLKLEARDG